MVIEPRVRRLMAQPVELLADSPHGGEKPKQPAAAAAITDPSLPPERIVPQKSDESPA